MYESHLRLTATGTIFGEEIFSFGVALDKIDRAGDPWQDALDPNATQWQDLVDDVAAYWLTEPIESSAVLRSVKIASIGPDGRYTSAPIERTVGAGGNGLAGNGGHSQFTLPQAAVAVTLHTAGDLGRVKGRYYLPMPVIPIADDGLIPSGNAQACQDRAQAFLNNLNNETGIDMLNLRVVVASQGRRNSNGTIRVAPKNHPVTGVSVGRVFDTMRSRRNALKEKRPTPSAVS